jgi:RNA-binding protein
MKPLVPVERRFLAKIGHVQKAVVQIGYSGVTPLVVESTAKALAARELIKVKINPNNESDRHEVAAELARLAGAELVQVVGKTFLLFKPKKKDSRIQFPEVVTAKAKRKRLKSEESPE